MRKFHRENVVAEDMRFLMITTRYGGECAPCLLRAACRSRAASISARVAP